MSNEKKVEKVDTFGEVQKPSPKPAPKRVACHVCHGLGAIEIPGNGDTKDCTNRKCVDGFILVG